MKKAVNRKPDSVRLRFRETKAARPSVWACRCRKAPCSLPALDRRAAGAKRNFLPRCLALLPMRLAVPAALLPPRRALTPPFHPYPGGRKAALPARPSRPAAATPRNQKAETFRFPRGGIFSAALSVARSFGIGRPGVTRHRALRSPDFPRFIAETA